MTLILIIEEDQINDLSFYLKLEKEHINFKVSRRKKDNCEINEIDVLKGKEKIGKINVTKLVKLINSSQSDQEKKKLQYGE